VLRQRGKSRASCTLLPERSFRVCAAPSSFDRLGYSGRASRRLGVVRHEARENLAGVLSEFRVRFGFQAPIGPFHRVFARRAEVFQRRERVRRIILGSVGLSLALGAPEAWAAGARGSAPIAITSDQNSGHVVDLGLLPPPANSDDPTPGPASTSKMNSAEPVPELATWAMMLLCFIGLAVAGYKKGRRNRLLPGID
jgi:hypothetical protein